MANRGAALDLSAIDMSSRNVVKTVDSEKLESEIKSVAQSLSQIENDTTRDALLSKLDEILKLEDVDCVNEELLTVKTMAYETVKEQDCRKLALQEIEKISHVDSNRANQVRELAEHASENNDVFKVRREVRAILDAEKARAKAEQEARIQQEEAELERRLQQEEAERERQLQQEEAEWERRLQQEEEKQEAELRRKEEAYVRSALEEVLSELGYQVTEEFQVTDYGSVAYANTNSPDYRLRLQVQGDSGSIYTRLVSVADTNAEQDAAAEEESCESIHEIMDKLASHGVNTTLKSEREPGERPAEKRAVDTRRHQEQARRRKQQRQRAAKNQARRSR